MMKGTKIDKYTAKGNGILFQIWNQDLRDSFYRDVTTVMGKWLSKSRRLERNVGENVTITATPVPTPVNNGLTA